jgi:hypothetical protein
MLDDSGRGGPLDADGRVALDDEADRFLGRHAASWRIDSAKRVPASSCPSRSTNGFGILSRSIGSAARRLSDE